VTIAPALYEGTVRHRRFAVRERAFRHAISMVYADLDAPPPALAGRLTADANVIRATAGTTGRVGVLTQLRTLRVGFNPVSFYFCHDARDTLRAIVAEVTSTPWGETERYVMDADAARRVHTATMPKRMHVSPFLTMDQHYSWSTTTPAPTDPMMSIHIALTRDDATTFDATMKLRRAPLTRRGLARHALLRLRVLPLIYAHALVLAFRRVPIHPHPETRPS
jgi:uncharacterized protein